MKTKQIIKGSTALLIILIELISLGLLGYSLYLYNGIETFYRIYGIIILLYILIVLSYFILRLCRSHKIKGFITVTIVSLVFSAIQTTGYYYLTRVYKAIDSYSNVANMYSSSLVSYNKELKTYKDLNNKVIGIVSDVKDISGNVLPLSIINEKKLEKNNKIKKYSSSIELLVALKDKEIDAAFFNSNYVDMFCLLEGYETIEEDTVILYTESKEYNTTEDTHDTTDSSFTRPFTMLFIGVDSSTDGVTSGYNADVLILVTFNPKTLQATMTSIPRDMYLKTACSGNAYRRINTTTWGSSSSCAVKTVEKMFDVNVDYYAKINFKGVIQLVDLVGGIDVFVDYPICDQNSNRQWGKDTIFIESGKQHLNGEQALALARNRHKAGDGSSVGNQMNIYCPTWTDGDRSDYTRGKNQLKVIMGVVNSATKLRDVNQAIKVLEEISKNFQTNIKSNDVMELYTLGKSLLLTENSTNLINVQRLQLKGFSQKIWDVNSKSYPFVTFPYNGSISDIKNEININLGKKGTTLIKKASFDMNNYYKDTVLGQGSYSKHSVPTLKNVSGYSVSDLKNYANNNKLKLKFIDIDTKNEVDINSWGDYKFNSQGEHIDTIINQISSLTIYVKKIEKHVPIQNNEENNEEINSNEE